MREVARIGRTIPARSAAVNTATAPGMARASSASIPFRRPVRDVGASEGDVEKPVQPPVVDEVAEPAQQPAVLAPGDAGADQAWACARRVRRGGRGHGPVLSAEQRASIVLTARTLQRSSARKRDEAGISPAPV